MIVNFRLVLVSGLLILASLSLNTSKADPIDIGNGGEGVMKNGKLYLLDLIEAGIEKNPALACMKALEKKPTSRQGVATVKRYNDILENVNSIFLDESFNLNSKSVLATKLTEIAEFDLVLAHSLLRAMGLMDWRMIDGPLKPVPADPSPIRIAGKEPFVQIAVRRETTVLVDRSKWNLLNNVHRAALILHETIYALVKTRNSWDARNINGYLFTPAFQQRGKAGLQTKTRGFLPQQLNPGKVCSLPGTGIVLIEPGLEVHAEYETPDPSVLAFTSGNVPTLLEKQMPPLQFKIGKWDSPYEIGHFALETQRDKARTLTLRFKSFVTFMDPTSRGFDFFQYSLLDGESGYYVEGEPYQTIVAGKVAFDWPRDTGERVSQAMDWIRDTVENEHIIFYPGKDVPFAPKKVDLRSIDRILTHCQVF